MPRWHGYHLGSVGSFKVVLLILIRTDLNSQCTLAHLHTASLKFSPGPALASMPSLLAALSSSEFFCQQLNESLDSNLSPSLCALDAIRSFAVSHGKFVIIWSLDSGRPHTIIPLVSPATHLSCSGDSLFISTTIHLQRWRRLTLKPECTATIPSNLGLAANFSISHHHSKFHLLLCGYPSSVEHYNADTCDGVFECRTIDTRSM